jgi:hypothetical protein
MEHLQKTDKRHPRRSDCAAMNERSHLLPQRKQKAKFLKYVTPEIKPDGNFDCLWDDFWIFVSY